jgi:gamma-glutamyltranspeptidase/glutathione hydrolase
MIVAPQPIAVEEGAKVLMAGGNAVDAAVTAALVQCVVDPHSCGIGGYILLNLHRPGSREPAVLDAPALAGARVAPDMWQERVIAPNPDGWGYFLRGKVNDLGYQSICTPGTVKGLSAMLQRWGTRSWDHALAPAIQVAEHGFVVGPHLASRWKEKSKHAEGVSALQQLQSHPEARRIYLKADGSPHDAGDRLRNPDYAKTLSRLITAGPDDFYRGELARRIAADLAAHDAFVTAEDLASYALRDERPVVGSYRGHTLTCPGAPHGGPTLIAILRILEAYDLAKLGHNSPDYIYLVSMAMKAAFADRNRWLGDPAFVSVPIDRMLSAERIDHWRREIDAGRPIAVSRAQIGSPDTTHLSVVDGRGTCVSLTHSLGSCSGAITPGLGFMYNNSMVNFHPYAGHPNSIAPRKGRTTGMTPTIVYRGDRPRLILGAPGATRIVTSCVQVILNVIDFSMSISDAVLAPRFDCQGDVIHCQARIPEFVCAAVRRRHAIDQIPHSHGGLALVHAIAIDPDTGRLSGAADTGAGGMALGV